MKCKAISFLLLLISLFLATSIFAEQETVSAEAANAAMCVVPSGGGRNAVTGSGNISMEVKNVDDICNKIQEIVKKHGAIMKNFNINADSNSRFKNAYMEAVIDTALAPAFMNDIIALGEVKSNSYNEQTQPDNADDLNKQLAQLNNNYEKLLQKKPDIEVSKVLVAKIIEVENRLRNLQCSQGNEDKARIYINVQQKGQNARAAVPGTAGKFWPFLATAIVSLLLGFFSKNFVNRKSNV